MCKYLHKTFLGPKCFQLKENSLKISCLSKPYFTGRGLCGGCGQAVRSSGAERRRSGSEMGRNTTIILSLGRSGSEMGRNTSIIPSLGRSGSEMGGIQPSSQVWRGLVQKWGGIQPSSQVWVGLVQKWGGIQPSS